MEFLKSTELELNPAGYLVSKVTKLPVTNEQFVKEQQNADYIVRLSEAIKDKTFVANTVDNLMEIKIAVMNAINDTSKKYVKEPKAPQSKVNDELVKYAMDFVSHQTDLTKTNQINDFMNQFNKIDDVETVGEYFTQGVVKLNKIYDIKTILNAVKVNVDKLS